MSSVGVNELARHLATNREGVARLVEAGVIERHGDGNLISTKAASPISSTSAHDREAPAPTPSSRRRERG